MIVPVIGTLKDAVLHSPFFAGGAALGMVGGVIAGFRKAPVRAWNYFLRSFTIAAEIPDTDPAFEWLQAWIHAQPAAKKIKNLTVNTKLFVQRHTEDDEMEAETPKSQHIVLAPAVGSHALRYNKRLLWLIRQRNEESKGKEKSEYWHIRVLGRNQDIVRTLISAAREVYMGVHKRPRIMNAAGSWWEPIGELPERGLDTVILPQGLVENILLDAETFLKSREWYSLRGVPYRRGYLFEGPPGTGKSSLVTALAHTLKKPVYLVNLGSFRLSDDNLVSLLSHVPSGAIVLFEDIDATTTNRAKKQDDDDDDGSREATGVTLSGLLNALDGLTAKDGRIAIMTTNHAERLDPALVRPGRVDKRFTLDYANEDQATRLFLRFFGDEEMAKVFGHIVGSTKTITPAAIQEHMLRYREHAKDALNNVADLLEKPQVEAAEASAA